MRAFCFVFSRHIKNHSVRLKSQPVAPSNGGNVPLNESLCSAVQSAASWVEERPANNLQTSRTTRPIQKSRRSCFVSLTSSRQGTMCWTTWRRGRSSRRSWPRLWSSCTPGSPSWAGSTARRTTTCSEMSSPTSRDFCRCVSARCCGSGRRAAAALLLVAVPLCHWCALGLSAGQCGALHHRGHHPLPADQWD